MYIMGVGGLGLRRTFFKLLLEQEDEHRQSHAVLHRNVNKEPFVVKEVSMFSSRACEVSVRYDAEKGPLVCVFFSTEQR